MVWGSVRTLLTGIRLLTRGSPSGAAASHRGLCWSSSYVSAVLHVEVVLERRAHEYENIVSDADGPAGLRRVVVLVV